VVQVPRRCPEQLSGVVQVPRGCVRSGTKFGLLSLRLSVSQGVIKRLSDAPACPIEKVTLCESFLYLLLVSEIDGVLRTTDLLPKLGIELEFQFMAQYAIV